VKSTQLPLFEKTGEIVIFACRVKLRFKGLIILWNIIQQISHLPRNLRTEKDHFMFR
jgi:hypothetical protein